VKFGRIEGQDYTRWDGKAITQIKTNLTELERMHELAEEYIHGREDKSFKTDPSNQATDCPFKLRMT
jgi:hypothetical protein